MRTWLSILVATTLFGATEEVGKFVGLLDVRPTWTTKPGAVGTENTVQAGYQFNPDRKLYYTQYINTSLYDPSAATNGLNPTLDLGFVGYKMKNIAKFEGSDISIHLEPRVYVPTLQSAAEAGMILVNRNYLIVRKKVNDTLTISVVEIPILQVYNRAGHVDADGKARANPVFENRVYLIADIQLAEKLSLSIPLMFYQTRYADFRADAVRNNSWGFSLYTWPEITYSVTDQVSVGAAYYNNTSFISSDLKYVDLGKSFESGAFQAVFAYKL